MQITFAMLWDMLNERYPALETAVYGGWPVRGIKLMPERDRREPDFLYLDSLEGQIRLSRGSEAPVILGGGLPLDEIFNALQDAFNRLRDWDMETHLALIGDCGAQTLLDLSEEILGNPITLMDPSFKLLARTQHIVSTARIYNEVCRQGYLSAETVEFYALRGYLEELSRSDTEGAFHNDPGYVSIIKAIRMDSRVIGYLTMPCSERLYSQGMAERFACLAAGVAQCMERELRSMAISRHMYQYVLLDLLEGGGQSADTLTERLKYASLPAEGSFRLLRLAGEREDAALEDYLVRQIADRVPNERVFPHRGAALVLLQDARLEWVLENLTPYLEGQGLACGVSRRFTRLTGIRAANLQADAALRLGRRVGKYRTLARLGVTDRTYERTVFHYDRFALHHMLEGAAEAGLLPPGLVRLLEIDRREHTDNLRVLYAYLVWERRPTQTSAALHMHRNNVIYRAARIEELMGVSLEDPAVRAGLFNAFCLLELSDIETIAQNAPDSPPA